jgi:hypothetical protein
MIRLLALLFLAAGACAAQVPGTALPRNQPTTVAATTAYDAATHFYTYNYAITNLATNSAAVDTLVVKLPVGVDVVTNIHDPQGWMHFYSEDRATIQWAAVGFIDPDAPADPSGNITVSDYAVRPGARLAGFSFDSFGAPGEGTIITQTFAPLPTAADEDDVEPADGSNWLPEDNGYRLSSVVPLADLDWDGNRRPTVDGFLVFANLKDKDSFAGSVLVVVRFATGGSSVQMDTFRARLNNVDVTASFAYNSLYKGYVATFLPSQGVLVNGNNVLLTSVSGTIPGVLDKPVTDTDRVSFKFAP